MFQKIDEDGNGDISFVEFTQFFEEMIAAQSAAQDAKETEVMHCIHAQFPCLFCLLSWRVCVLCTFLQSLSCPRVHAYTHVHVEK